MSSSQQPTRPLKGKIALVTGGSRGIGFAIARRLAILGASVAICARDKARLSHASEAVSNEGITVLPIATDVTQAAEVSSLIEEIRNTLGDVEILVNNAGVGIFGPFYERSVSEWTQTLDTNLKSVFLVSKAVAPAMIRMGRGYMINISSLASKSTFSGGGVYCASKWGLMGLTGCMAEELRSHGIRVSVICPGSVATEFSGHAGRNSASLLEPADVAHAVEMLVTEGSNSFISEIHVRPLRKS